MAPLFLPSELFTVGRDCAGPLAVVLHQIDTDIGILDQQMEKCYRPRRITSPGCHTSFHYGISGNCYFHQYVDIADTAWGFGVQTPACPVPPCPPTECESCTGLTVEQYNPDMDGNPPVLPALVAGADGTANCGVIHVAVSNIFQRPGNIGACCDPNPQAYNCIVQSLAEIFTAAELVPTQTTLLVHCGELVCLDIDQLVLDVIEAQIIVPPAVVLCNCTPTVGQLCEAISNVPAGAVAVPGVTLLLGADCLTHTIPDVLATIETCDGPYEEGDALVNANDVPLATPTSDTATIWASDNETTCPSPLIGVLYDPELLPATNVVLGVANDLTPQWSTIARPAMSVDTFTELDAAISPDDADVMRYTGAGVHNVTLNAGTVKTDMWIKNSSADVLTVTAGSGTIDGVASVTLQGTIPAGYPFGNNGGESIHVVNDGTNWFII